MAWWLEAVRTRRRLCFSEGLLGVALIFIVIGVSVPKSYAQSGFLSIDCGNTGNNYTSNNLTWVADDGSYITTGRSSEEVFLESSVGGNQALRSYRFFPESRSKYCYELPTADPQESSYLFRASFYMNETVLKAAGPFKFVLSIDGTDWFTVSSGNGSQTSLLIVQEGLFYPPNEVTYFCLRPVNGVPFISSLEVRSLLKDTFYVYNGWSTQYLSLISRYNTGANSTVPNLRYPDDLYDRIWTTPDASLANVLPIISDPGAPSSLDTLDSNSVPVKVMKDAWLFQNTSTIVTFGVYLYGPQLYITPSQYIYAVVYSEDLNTTASQFENVIYSTIVGVDHSSADSTPGQTFNNSTINVMAFPFFYTTSDIINASLRLCEQNTAGTCEGDGRLPSMNAIEFYGQYNYNFSITNPDDDEVITDLKNVLSLTDWQGDPCVPVPHDWLSCSLVLSQRNPICYVTSINISNAKLSVYSANETSSSISLNRLNEM